MAQVRAYAHTSQRLKPVVCARLGTELVEQARAEAGQVGAAAAQHQVGGHGGAHVARALEERAGGGIAQVTRRRSPKPMERKRGGCVGVILQRNKESK